MKTLTVTAEGEESILLGAAPFHLLSFEGYADTEADTVIIQGIQQDGAQYVNSFLQPKDINLVVRLRADSALELNELRQRTSRVFNPKNGLLTLVFEDETGAKEIQAVCEHMPKFGGSDQRRDGIFQNVQLSLLAPSPYWRMTETVEKPLYAWIPKTTFPMTFGNMSPYIRADFANKITGDLESNPHRAFYANSTVIRTPTDTWTELTQTQYDQIEVIEGTNFRISNGAANSMPQFRARFDILAALEAEFGADVWEGDTTTAGRVAIAKDLISLIHYRWHGYNTAPAATGGNKASFAIWLNNTSTYTVFSASTAGTVTQIDSYTKDTYSTNTPNNVIDANGFININVYGNPSDGTTYSYLYTDFIMIEIQTEGRVIQMTVFGEKGAAETVENTGGDGAPVLITITGYVDTPTIWNRTTGEFITLHTIVEENERVEINTDDNNLTIELISENGTRTDIFARMSIDSTLFTLVRGENVIEYTALAQSDNSTVSFTYSELYAGI